MGRIVISLMTYPIDYVKILIQLGYEPLPPYPTRTIFGRQRLALPGLFKYMGHIQRTDGFFSIYRGIGYKLTSVLINGFVYVNVNESLKSLQLSEQKSSSDQKENTTSSGIDWQKYSKLCIDLSRETGSRLIALLVSYPFQVMTVRVCAQFVGTETQYNSLFGAVADIYQTGGIAGFYSGFIPRYLGDVLCLWIGSNVIFFVNSWIDGESLTKSYVSASVNFIVSSVLYPFQLVSTVMCCNGSNARSLAASAYTGPEFTNWVDCWRYLSQMGEIKRGSALLWRYQNPMFIAPLYTNPVPKGSNLKIKEW